MKFFFLKPLSLVLTALTLASPITAQEGGSTILPPALPKPKPKLVNGFAATVNGEVITLNELMIKVAPSQSVLMSQFPKRGPLYQNQLRLLKDAILDELIVRAIIFSEFKGRIDAIPEAQIEAEVKRIIQNVYKGDEELFRKFLKAANLTRDQFKQQQRKELLVQIVRSQHFGDVPVPTSEELQAEYKKWAVINHDRKRDKATFLRIYLRKDRRGGRSAQLALAERLKKRLKEGADFAALAKTYSDDAHAQLGGLWKDDLRDDRTMEFGYNVFDALAEKEIGLFEDQYGFNIVQVIEREFGPAPPFSESREIIQRRVIAEKKKGNFEKWMKKMKSRAVIKKMLKHPDANGGVRR